jgi:DNA replication and repair protein RecF
VWVRRLELVDFRNYEQAALALGPGLTAVVGANGQGKSNLMEAVGYLATLESFRGVPGVALVRDGSPRAVVRAEVVQPDGRTVSIECELPVSGRDRILVNKQRLRRTSDLLGVVRVTVFSPDDLALVKEGPALRRRFLDQTAISLHPRVDADRRDLERILKHKSTLLKQVGGRLGEEAAFTLDVWNAKLTEVGERIGEARAELVAALGPEVARAYADLVDAAHGGRVPDVGVRYEPAWRSTGLAAALDAARADEVRRQVCLVGPHRDDLELSLAGLPARTHASQGEQRTLALALRLAAHRLVTARVDDPPVLVLDDVFSELDPARSAALLRHLPPGQVLLTTAGPLPAEADVERVVHVERGRLTG